MEKTKYIKYQAYKPSGVDWLGEIPQHWERKPFIAIAKVFSEINQPDRELLSVYLEKGVIRFSEVEEKRTNVTSEDLSKYQVVEPGNLVLNNQQAWRGSVGISNHFGIVSPAYIVLKISNDLNPHFANYLFRNGAMVSNYLICSKGVGTIQRNLYWPQLKRVIVCFPPLPEQEKIATFLDDKTARIDSLIAQKEKMIALLKERKQIIIQQAVTGKKVWNKEKNAWTESAEVKDSGVEWIGEVPEHWEVLFNRRLFREKSRYDYGQDEIALSLSQIDGVIPSIEMKERSLSPSHRNNFKLCLPGDLIVNRFKGHLGVFFESKYRGLITFHYGVFEPHNKINSKYFEHLFHTEQYKAKFAGASNGMTIGLQNLSNQNFYDIKAIVPPYNEQNDIVNYIESKNSLINQSIATIEQQIEKLKEYKTVLVDSVVTGKIKVFSA